MKHHNSLLLSCRRLWPVAVVVTLAGASHLIAARASARLNRELTQLPLRHAAPNIAPKHVGVPDWEETEAMVATSEPTLVSEAAPVVTKKIMPPRRKHTAAKTQRAKPPMTSEFIPQELAPGFDTHNSTVEPQPTESLEQWQPQEPENALTVPNETVRAATLTVVPTPEASSLPVRAQNTGTETMSLDTNKEAAPPEGSPLPKAEP